MALGYSTQRGYGGTHPFAGEIRMGEVSVEIEPPELGFAIDIGDITVTECQMVNQFKGSKTTPPQFTRGYGLVFGFSERKAMAMALVDRAMRAEELGEEVTAPAQNVEFVLYHSRQHRGDRLRRASEAAALRRFPERAAERAAHAAQKSRARARSACGGSRMKGYNFAYLDEQTKRMIRRALLKAVAIPGHQVPFGSREMPLPYGWGTGGIQVTASVLGADDVLKVIDQGADDTTNAVSIRRFFARTAGVRTTTHTAEATVIQTRHRIPEKQLRDDQIIVYQVPQPEPLFRLEPSRVETRRMHALADYGLMHVKLYEDIARFGQISISYDYPVMVNERYLMSPSPIPAFDNPKMDMMPALQLFGAGREKRIYAIPPWTEVRSLDFEDHPFRADQCAAACGLCGATDAYLDEVVTDDRGGRLFVCSDTDYCAERRAAAMSAPRAAGGGGMSRRHAAVGARPGAVVRRDPGAGAMSMSISGRARCWPIVGESGSGKTTLLNVLSGPAARRSAARSGIAIPPARLHDVHAMPAPALRTLHRSDWGFVHQDPRAEPAHERHRRRQCRRAADGAGRAALRRHPRARRSTGWRRWRSTPTASTTCRAPSPAACCSACRSPAPW